MAHHPGAPYLSVVIPAYNEQRRLPRTLNDVVAYLRRQSYPWEILVVDDGSRDKTQDVVAMAAACEPRIRLLRYPTNRGKGYAVRLGMLTAAGRYRLFMDADNSTTIDHLEQFLPRLVEGAYDVVIGSRDVRGSDIAVRQPKWRDLLGNVGNLWIQLWAVPGIRDTQAGFKLFSARAAQDVFSRVTIERFGFDLEALAIARLCGHKTLEHPIRWANDSDSRVTLRAYAQVLREVVQVRLNLWRGVYAQPRFFLTAENDAPPTSLRRAA